MAETAAIGVKQRLLFILLLGFASLLVASIGDGTWLTRVPERDRARSNPFAGSQEAFLAGAKLFQQNCSACHGKNAEGKGKKPSLHSERVKSATPGELQWLLTNGSMKNGMPSWVKLPEQQRWQIISYLKSMN